MRCSTWSRGWKSRSPPAPTCAPRRGPARAARRRTSRPGRRSSEPTRAASPSAATTPPASSSRASSRRAASTSSARSARARRASSSRSSEGGDRSLASGRGVGPSLEPAELEEAWLDCDVLHLSGYALLADPIAQAALRAAQLARELGARVSVDVAAWTEIRTLRPGRVPRAARRARARRPVRDRGGVGAARRRLPHRADRRPQARRARLHRPHRGRDARLRARRGGGRRPDGRGRRARGRLPAGRLARGGRAARVGGGRPLRRDRRLHAVKVQALTDAQAAQIAEWRYEFPYEWYDTVGRPAARRALREPRPPRRTSARSSTTAASSSASSTSSREGRRGAARARDAARPDRTRPRAAVHRGRARVRAPGVAAADVPALGRPLERARAAGVPPRRLPRGRAQRGEPLRRDGAPAA